MICWRIVARLLREEEKKGARRSDVGTEKLRLSSPSECQTPRAVSARLALPAHTRRSMQTVSPKTTVLARLR